MQGFGHMLSGDPGAWFWWVGAGVLLVIELISGTFYLLMIALGFLLAGGARLMGASGPEQVLVAGVLALAAVVAVRVVKRAWRRRRLAKGSDPASSPSSASISAPSLAPVSPENIYQRDPSGSLDIGAAVWVNAWHEGRARVQYRGAQWDAALREGSVATSGWYHIHQIDGIRLILVP